MIAATRSMLPFRMKVQKQRLCDPRPRSTAGKSNPHSSLKTLLARGTSALGLVYGLMLPPMAFAQEALSDSLRDPRGQDGRLKTDILLIVAHPDDESAVGPYLARTVLDEHRSVAVVYVADGIGGRSVVGTERGKALGAVRQLEARAALAQLGITHTWFLSGRGTFSHNVLKSLATLDHGRILEQLVGIIRLTRPEIVLTWIPASLGDHGDHQASGAIATEAFELAGDPSVFPSQLAFALVGPTSEFGGLQPWQPKKLYYFTDARDVNLEDTGPSYVSNDVSPSRGLTYEALAGRSAAEHRTQEGLLELAEALERGEPLSVAGRRFEEFYGFPLFPNPIHFILGKSQVSSSATADLFSGIEPGTIRFEPSDRGESMQSRADETVRIELAGSWSFYRAFWSAHGIEHLASLQEPSTRMRPNEPELVIPLLLANPTFRRQVVRISAMLPEGWEVTGGVGTYGGAS